MGTGSGKKKSLLLERHAIQSAAEINSFLFSSLGSVRLLSSPYRRREGERKKPEALDFYIYVVK